MRPPKARRIVIAVAAPSGTTRSAEGGSTAMTQAHSIQLRACMELAALTVCWA
jgi:hypothetical protein